MVIDALMGIQDGQNPRVIESLLQNYLPRSKRMVEGDEPRRRRDGSFGRRTQTRSRRRPAWVMTFADLMSLLMCFFVLLLAFSEMDAAKFKQLSGSMKEAFGVQAEMKADYIPKGTSVVTHGVQPGSARPDRAGLDSSASRSTPARAR